MLLVFAIVGLFGTCIMSGVLLVKIFEYGFDKKLLSKALITLTFLIIFWIGYIGIDWIESMNYEMTSQTGDWELMVISDANQDKTFYIQTAIDSDNSEYTFYCNEGGRYKRLDVKTENVRIFVSDNCLPQVIQYTTYTKNELNENMLTLMIFNLLPEEKYSYLICIPNEEYILRTSK